MAASSPPGEFGRVDSITTARVVFDRSRVAWALLAVAGLGPLLVRVL